MRRALCVGRVTVLLAVLVSQVAAAEGKMIRVGGLELSAECALLRNEHPRILFTRAELPHLRERCRTVARGDYERLRAALDGLKGPSSGTTAAHAQALGVLYQLSGENRYAEAARKILETGKTGYRSRDYSQAYDLIYETLTREQRIDLAKPLVELTRKAASPGSGMEHRRSFLAALAIHGAGAMDDQETLKHLAGAAKVFKRHMRLRNVHAKGRGAPGCEGLQYFFGPTHIIEVHAWKNCTGEDLWPEMNWLKQLAAFRTYHWSPFEVRTVHVGLADKGRQTAYPMSGISRYSALEYTYLLAHRYRDGLCQWWTDEGFKASRSQARDRTTVYQLFGRVLYRDAEVPAIPPGKFPPARFFAGPGWVVMRSDWSKDAVYAHFQCGPLENGCNSARSNSDNASFLIERSGHLANDTGTTWGFEYALDYGGMQKRGGMNKVYYSSGPMEGNHHCCYSNRTIAHNSMLIFDKDEMQGDWAGINDGGQLRRSPSRSWKKKFGTKHPGVPHDQISGVGLLDYGEMLAYESSPLFDYACGDATRSYSPHKLEFFTRQFVYLRPEVFVVFDRVVSTRPEFPKRWILHTNEMPGPLDGKDTRDPEVCRAGDYLPLDARDPKAGHYLSTGRTHTASDMGGRLFVTTLLPKRAIIRKIGGRGHEFCVGGRNPGVPSAHTYRIVSHPPNRREKNLSREAIGSTFGLAGWRMEVEPSVKQRANLFLHVLQAAEKSRKEMATAVLIERRNAAGVTVTLGTKVYEVTFNSTGDVGGHIKVTDADKVVLDRDLAGHVEDNYKGWKDDPRYKEWMTNSHMRTVIGEKEQDEYRRKAGVR